MTSFLLVFLFFLSGISGLIYQVVWMRMLIRVFGISLYAISTVVAVFMGGLAVGSWIAGRLYKDRRVSLKAYAVLEGAIALAAAGASIGMKHLPNLYASFASTWYGPGSMLPLIRFLFAVIALALPTILMGATLPIIGQFLAQRNSNSGWSLALLYGANTVGAVVGVMVTGFVSLALVGESGSIVLGVAINLLVAAIAFAVHHKLKEDGTKIEKASSRSDVSRKFFFVIAGLTGFCALSLEILWSRLSIFLVGSSVYSFSVVLSIYLLGIGAGSLVATKFIERLKHPQLILGAVQICIALSALGSLYVFWKLGLSFSELKFLYSPLRSANDLFSFFGVACLILLPPTFFMGISFPLLGRLVSPNPRKFADSVGTLYAWNTVGAVLGSLLTGYLLVPAIGTQASVCLIALLSLVVGGVVVLREKRGRNTWLVLGGVAALFLVSIPSRTDVVLDILKRRLGLFSDSVELLFQREDPGGFLTGIEIPQGSLLLINGIIISGNGIPGHLMAHLPLLMHTEPKAAAVICFGVGNTFRAAVDHVGNVDAVELMPGVIKSFGDFFSESDRYLKAGGARVFVEDGRQHLLMTHQRYDVIVVDASPPIFSAGTVNLYTMDFLEICRSKLTSDGIMCLWVPTPCFEKDFWRITRGFEKVFPHVFVWAKPGMAGVVVMGSATDLAAAFSSVNERRIAQRSLGESSRWLTTSFLKDAVIMTDEQIRLKSAIYSVVTDDRPLTEFPLTSFLRKEKFWSSNGFLYQELAN